MRGRGRSDPVHDGTRLGIEFDVSDLEALREHLGIGQMSLVGFSYLGAVVVLYTAQHPDRVVRIVQLSPVPPRSSAEYLRQGPPAGAGLDPDEVALVEEMERSGVPDSDPERYCRAYWSAFLVRYVGDAAAAERIDLRCDLPNEWPQNFTATTGKIFSKLTDWDWRPAGLSVRAPTLTIHGDLDRVAPLGGGRDWAATLSNARLLIVPGAGHLIWGERPQIFLEAVDRFLKGEWPTGAKEVVAEP
jgi:proline iminopeptidase